MLRCLKSGILSMAEIWSCRKAEERVKAVSFSLNQKTALTY